MKTLRTHRRQTPPIRLRHHRILTRGAATAHHRVDHQAPHLKAQEIHSLLSSYRPAKVAQQPFLPQPPILVVMMVVVGRHLEGRL